MGILIKNGVDQDVRWTDAVVVSYDNGKTWASIRKSNIKKISPVYLAPTQPGAYKYDTMTKLRITDNEGRDFVNTELQDLSPDSSYHSDNEATIPWNLGTATSLANAVNEINSWL